MGARNQIWDFWKSSSALTWLSSHQLSGEKVLCYFVKQKRFLERQLSLLAVDTMVRPPYLQLPKGSSPRNFMLLITHCPSNLGFFFFFRTKQYFCIVIWLTHENPPKQVSKTGQAG